MTELLNTLYIQTPGASLHLEHDTVRVVIPEVPQRHVLPLRRLESIVVMGNIQISSQLMSRCAEDGRPIVWMSRGGRFLNRTDGPTRGNVLLRHAQHLAHADPVQCLGIAQACVAGKIQNCRQVVLRAARDAPKHRTRLREVAETLADAVESLSETEHVDSVFGVEGSAARVYFEAFALMLRTDTGIDFPGRVKRPATDPANALLSFLYGLTRSMVHGACEQVGLDPYIGFLHGLRPGKPALVLDLMEELRPVAADRIALTLVNRKQVRSDHFETLPGGAVQLTEEGRKEVLTQWQAHRKKEFAHRLLGRKVPMALLPAAQARILARHVRGDLPDYLPWTL
ncbi:type I-C CRISPR-associated endonuclease Cas1c [Nocardiopsis sp. LOL_012]|uniref:type I-C CRISPR-associated endonuclease Cas1c n=1 Tax=Nocardiopsis sp. LOL_012 TaxID=3345409 RepID=UPI003A883FE1